MSCEDKYVSSVVPEVAAAAALPITTMLRVPVLEVFIMPFLVYLVLRTGPNTNFRSGLVTDENE